MPRAAKRARAEARTPQILKTVSFDHGTYGPGDEAELQAAIEGETVKRESIVRLTQKGAIAGFVDFEESEAEQGAELRDPTLRAAARGRQRRAAQREDAQIDEEVLSTSGTES